MTNTEPAAREVTICADCAIVIANGDASGIEDADAHLAAMDAHASGYVIVIGDADLGFRTDTCATCGTYTATDQWFDAIIEED
jgi:hypothetical protein